MGMSVYGRKGMQIRIRIQFIGWLLVVEFVPSFIVRVVWLGGERLEFSAPVEVAANDVVIPRRRRRERRERIPGSCSEEF